MSESVSIDTDQAQGEISRRRFLRNAAVFGIGVPALSLAIEACGGGPGTASASGGPGHDPWSNPKYNFTLVNHVTTNFFFVPTQYGAADACALTGCAYQWTGSQTSNVSEMVNAMNAAIDRKVDGIGVAVIDNQAFVEPTNRALAAGIPVVAYNAEASSGTGNKQMAYIGQDNFQAGVEAAKRILMTVKRGDLVAAMIATPGSLNLQPRIDGAKSILGPAGVNVTEVSTGAAQGGEINAVESWYQGHQNVKFLYAVDGGTGIAVATTVQKFNLKAKGIGGSGWDVGVPTLQQVRDGNLTFTIDQQAYLQGFIPIMQLFMYQVSGGLMRPVPSDTGLTFVTSANVAPYLASQDRYEGSSSAIKVLPAPSSIQV
jgi:simple sugar transport system substrate-binding protein